MKSRDQKETMFENSRESVSPELPESQDGGAVNGQGEGLDGEESPVEIDKLREDLAAATRTAEENYDLYLRERAELENFKKRTQRDRAEAARYASESLARDILSVVDNLSRAIDHARASGDSPTIVEGVDLVLKGATEVLERHGVTRVEAEGLPFDPSVHEAIVQVADDAVEANHVVEQFLPGYRMHDRLLRAAQVSVSTGSDKEEEK